MATNQSYATIWSKSLVDRIYVLFLWVMFLVFLNVLIYWWFDWRLLAWAVITGFLTYRKLSGYKNTRFTFAKDQIKITISAKKQYILPKKDIEEITMIQPSRTGVTSLWKVANYLSSHVNVLHIHMKDKTNILISPRLIKDRVWKNYKIKKL